ncbi:uncharacterized protein EV420DRAFT_1645029 [Desarmillaria tabescens]|uniref:Uncharacterized protein n=1 Tax=Armillaria tabescens TaxID=1929756 RepID=A0AA39K434_ARMTA|nr:uncharacterized protein EV420DRAFT_1645029 [Desarmillaria tabescens]KAK0454169.1 hypothetical protein EV420DRAFT_1645029 [Desarmillaria tabescens]
MNIFVLGLIFKGMGFQVGLWDNTGGIISSEYEICRDQTGLDLFICVIYRLTGDMSLTELGMDLTVKLKDGHTLYGKEYTSFTFQAPDYASSTVTEVTTIGPPLWVNLCLSDTAGSTWKCADGGVCVVNWWRACQGDTKTEHPFSAVLLPSHKILDTGYIRARLSIESSRLSESLSTLHRNAIHRNVKMLWQAMDSREFILGPIDIFEGYIDACHHGEMYDLHAGNVFLCDNICMDISSGTVRGFTVNSGHCLIQFTTLEILQNQVTAIVPLQTLTFKSFILVCI